MFEFTGLRTLHEDMKKKNEISASFNFNYNNRGFACIFLGDVMPMLLYLCTVGEAREVFEILIDENYMTDTYIDDYRKLIEYLNLKFDPNHKFKPVDFFEVLNRNIPKTFQNAPDYKEIVRTASKTRKIEEAYKIYFFRWNPNKGIKKVTDENYEKTRLAFGDKIANLSRKTNKSSCWTDKEGFENLKTFDKIFND